MFTDLLSIAADAANLLGFVLYAIECHAHHGAADE